MGFDILPKTDLKIYSVFCSVLFWVKQSCDASLLLDSTRRELGEKEHDRSFGLRNFRYIEEIKEALERECPGVVSCSDILVLSAREGIEAVSLKDYNRAVFSVC